MQAMHTVMHGSLLAMIRKQVYIEPHHERMLKRLASQRGVTEAEIIREALDSVEAAPVVRVVDRDAGHKALAFMHALATSLRRVPRGRTRTRGSLYEDRISRLTKRPAGDG